jgi:hypothetical protein
MNAARLFARLSDRSSNYDFMPFSETVSAVNLALYTKGMYRKAYVAARLVWSKDLSVRNELSAYVYERTMLTAVQERWKIKDCERRIQALVELALIEHYAPSIFRTEKSKYQFTGIPESKWYRVWGRRYEVPYGIIRSYLDLAWGSLARN